MGLLASFWEARANLEGSRVAENGLGLNPCELSELSELSPDPTPPEPEPKAATEPTPETPAVEPTDPAAALRRSTPWRLALADWPDDWRRQWGELANANEADGLDWHEAERAAFDVVCERRFAPTTTS